jgi:hypothetical protein
VKSIRSTSIRAAVVLTVVAAVTAVAALSSGAAPAQAAAPAGYTQVGILDTAHAVPNANLALLLYGAYAVDPPEAYATFDQHVMPSSIPQVVEPYILVPDGNPHTYHLLFHVKTDGTTTSQFQLKDQHGYSSTQSMTAGDGTVEFYLPVQFSSRNWEPLTLTDTSGDLWVFYSCEVDLQNS